MNEKNKLKPQFVGTLQILQPATNKQKTNGHYRDMSLHRDAYIAKQRESMKRLQRSLRIAQEKQEKENDS